MSNVIKRVREDCKFKLLYKIRKLEEQGWKRGKIQRETSIYSAWECYMHRDNSVKSIKCPYCDTVTKTKKTTVLCDTCGNRVGSLNNEVMR